MLLPDCESLSQAFASGACQSVNSVFQRQRGKPILELFCFPATGSSVILEMLSGELSETWTERSIGGSLVEHSLPTRESQARFPANAQCFSLLFPSLTFHASSLFARCIVKSETSVVLATRSRKMRTKILKAVLSRRL